MEQRDLLLVPFPFSDQRGRKVRPVLIISSKEFNDHYEDVIVLGVTSKVSKSRYGIFLTNKNLDEGKLFNKCSIRVDNILKIDKELIIKKIGKINKETFKKVIKKILEIIKES